MTAFEDFVNRELPRRRTLLTNAIVTYDGDPRSSSAPAEIQDAPVGTLYLQETPVRIWERLNGGWARVGDDGQVRDENFTIYVDTAGDDANPGSLTEPIKTPAEAFRRVPLIPVDVTIQFGAGNFALEDYAGTDNRNQVFALKTVRVQGTNSLVQTLNVTGWVDNVATVTDTLTPGALVGKYIQFDQFGFTFHQWIIANTASTITVAISVVSFGGFLTGPTGSVEVRQNDTKIVQPATNPNNFENRLYYYGQVYFFRLTFDQSVNGGSGGPTAQGGAVNEVTFEACDWRGAWARGMEASGFHTLYNNWFEGCTSYAHGQFNGYTFMTADNVFKDCGVGFKIGNSGEVACGKQNTAWMLSCSVMTELDAGSFYDGSDTFWIDGGGAFTPDSWVVMDGDATFSIDLFNGAVGHNTLAYFCKLRQVLSKANLADSANFVGTLTTGYLLTPAGGISLAAWLAGTPPATGVKRYSDDTGNIAFN